MSCPKRHRLELLDWSVGASSRGVSGFLYIVEGGRPRHPHPEASQGGVREAAIAGKILPRPLLSDGLRNQAWVLKKSL